MGLTVIPRGIVLHMNEGKKAGVELTPQAVALNIMALICFLLWFICVYITRRADLDEWSLIVGFGVSSLMLRLIPLCFISIIVSSVEYAEFWEIPKDEIVEEKPTSSVDQNHNCQHKSYFIQVKRSVVTGLAAFMYAWAFFTFINTATGLGLLAILSYTLEGFCVVELLKAGPTPELASHWAGGGAMDFGFFKYVIANALCTTQRLFGLRSGYMWLVFAFCLVLVSLHNAIPRSAYCIEENNKITMDENSEDEFYEKLCENVYVHHHCCHDL